MKRMVRKSAHFPAAAGLRMGVRAAGKQNQRAKRKPPARQSAPAAARGSVPEANPQSNLLNQ